MKIVVIGLGSMGKRRIRLIREMYPGFLFFGVDERMDRRNEASSLFDIETFSDVSEAPVDAECAFVCTSPLTHSKIISECLDKNYHVFSEINLVSDGYIENIALAKKKQLKLFLSSTFLYRDETNYIKSYITTDKKWNYIYHVGQYLPDWHPWESYKDFFVSNNKTNGCREILAIEMPWIVASFGQIKSFNVMANNISGLHIDFPDNFMIQFEHNNGNKGSLIIDVVSPNPVRRFEAYSENSYISWEGTPDTLKIFNMKKKLLENIRLTDSVEHIESYVPFVVENAYKNEIKHFFEIINGTSEYIYTFEKDLEILQMIDNVGA